jgi:phospholipid-binding lipoprotein MlaA
MHIKVFLKLVILAACAFAMSACAATRQLRPDFVPPPAEEAWDPLEPVNRGVFWFNDKLDDYLIEPASKGYDYITPEFVQRRVSNFFSNLKGPANVINSLLQLKPDVASEQFGRFFINTTIGLVGLFDVATDWGMEAHSEGLGETLALYGIPSGPYLVLPLLGPSNIRDGVGLLGDAFADPSFYAGNLASSTEAEWGIVIGLKTLQVLQTRIDLKDAIDASKESSLDRYLFVQSAYYQFRHGRIYDGKGSSSDLDEGESEPTFDSKP